MYAKFAIIAAVALSLASVCQARTACQTQGQISLVVEGVNPQYVPKMKAQIGKQFPVAFMMTPYELHTADTIKTAKSLKKAGQTVGIRTPPNLDDTILNMESTKLQAILNEQKETFATVFGEEPKYVLFPWGAKAEHEKVAESVGLRTVNANIDLNQASNPIQAIQDLVTKTNSYISLQNSNKRDQGKLAIDVANAAQVAGLEIVSLEKCVSPLDSGLEATKGLAKRAKKTTNGADEEEEGWNVDSANEEDEAAADTDVAKANAKKSTDAANAASMTSAGITSSVLAVVLALSML